MDEKYEIVFDEPEVFFGKKLYRIIAKRSFYAGFSIGSITLSKARLGTPVRKGDLGGYVEGDWNLSHEDSCWIGKGAAVFGKAQVVENATVFGISSFSYPTCTVRDRAKIYGSSVVKDFAQVRDSAKVGGCAVIRQYARIEDCSTVIDSDVGGHACISNDIFLKGADKILDFNAKPQRIVLKKDLEKALISVEQQRYAEIPS